MDSFDPFFEDTLLPEHPDLQDEPPLAERSTEEYQNECLDSSLSILIGHTNNDTVLTPLSSFWQVPEPVSEMDDILQQKTESSSSLNAVSIKPNFMSEPRQSRVGHARVKGRQVSITASFNKKYLLTIALPLGR